ncbi:sensor histidine kinase [Psychromonas algicola]|uniref:sensor histidine kinase n=1 Tax=Psychromonas algicola TaxID=2555642 RepID=UPI001068884B|nr:HAMP domain-containing sensor histidine kinase [Psychromonas sp. RZ5]TEW52938.1 HAMP domain-containing histidine kinase [Psychromonas sp. RZ5]
MSKHDPLDFSTILATSVHDIKNSLFMLLQSIENLDLAENLTTEQHKSFADLHYQASGINSTVMQLLSLYRDEKHQLPIYIEENSVSELLEDLIDRHRLYLNSNDINVTIDVDDDLIGYFDADLIGYVLSDIFVNALRHTKDTIDISAFSEGQFLVLKIEDNGDGFPKHMMDINKKLNEFYNFNASKGRSGLGLLFAKKIAAAHKSKDLKGEILLENKPNNTGCMFTLRLP